MCLVCSRGFSTRCMTLTLAASVRLDRDELSWAGPLWREALESPHLAYICALRSFNFWLMASSSFTKAGLFRSRRFVRLWAALAPVATAGAAFQSLGHRRQTFYTFAFSYRAPHVKLSCLWDQIFFIYFFNFLSIYI